MLKEFKLPDLGEGLKEGTLVEWKVAEGDTITADQVVAEVETDKATTPLPSPFAGKVVKLHGSPGQTIPVGAVLITVETTAAGAPAAKPAPAAATPAPATPAPARTTTPAPAVAPTPAARPAPAPVVATATVNPMDILAAPATRRLAREKGIDLRQVKGTGPGGRITQEDVLAYASRPSGVPALEIIDTPTGEGGMVGMPRPVLPDFSPYGQVERQRVTAIRKRIVQKMTLSTQITASVTLSDEADVTDLETLRQQSKPAAEKLGIKLTLMPILVKAVAAALKQFPVVNASYDDDKQEIVFKKYYNIGIAVDSPQGLLVPVVRDADRRPMGDIAKEISGLAELVRTGKITAEQMRGGTFTITNVGAIGGLNFTPVINWPEVAILGLGRLNPKVVMADDGEFDNRKMLPLALTFDHRIIDGADAARFLNQVRQYLENPLMLLLDI
jgi:pyruvate dehydrogenase E2 component (dihydrolipoamide acetyltransferase)